MAEDPQHTAYPRWYGEHLAAALDARKSTGSFLKRQVTGCVFRREHPGGTPEEAKAPGRTAPRTTSTCSAATRDQHISAPVRRALLPDTTLRCVRANRLAIVQVALAPPSVQVWEYREHFARPAAPNCKANLRIGPWWSPTQLAQDVSDLTRMVPDPKACLDHLDHSDSAPSSVTNPAVCGSCRSISNGATAPAPT